MEERILRLCKRLNKCTLEELVTITEDINETVLELILTMLTADGKLIKKGDVYIYNQKVKKPKPQIMQMYDKQTIALIIKCYCANIASSIAMNIIGLSDDVIGHFYHHFRNKIYEQQYANLISFYSLDPLRARHCKFFEQEVYLYIYNNRMYVSETYMDNSNNRAFKTNEIKTFKIIYSYISRILSHNKNSVNLCPKIAEAIWRRNKSFEELYFELQKMLFS